VGCFQEVYFPKWKDLKIRAICRMEEMNVEFMLEIFHRISERKISKIYFTNLGKLPL